MGGSLWVDETLTYWVANADPAEVVHRALTYQQSPLYYLLVWPFARVTGGNEIVLRLPSVAASVVTAVLLWRLAQRLVPSPGSGAVAVIAFMGTAATLEAYDARPYALASAFSVGAALALVRLLDRPSLARAAAYGALAAGMLWAHYMFAPVLAAHAVYAAARVRRGSTSLRAKDAAAAIVVGTVLLAPLVGQIASLWSRRGTLSTTGLHPLLALGLVVPLIALPALLVAVVACRGRVRFVRASLSAQASALILAWSFLPWLFLWAATALSDADLLVGRYLVPSAPAAALAVAWGVACLSPARARHVLIVAMAVITALTFGLFVRRDDDWRGAVATAATLVRPDTPVLARVKLVEAKQVEWLTDTERRSYVLAPFHAYPLASEPVPLPLFPHDPGAEAYLDGVLDDVIDADRFVLVEQGEVYRAWLQERLGPLGWSHRIVGDTTEPYVVEFTRA
jgi:mannosyltransferase